MCGSLEVAGTHQCTASTRACTAGLTLATGTSTLFSWKVSMVAPLVEATHNFPSFQRKSAIREVFGIVAMVWTLLYSGETTGAVAAGAAFLLLVRFR